MYEMFYILDKDRKAYPRKLLFLILIFQRQSSEYQ